MRSSPCSAIQGRSAHTQSKNTRTECIQGRSAHLSFPTYRYRARVAFFSLVASLSYPIHHSIHTYTHTHTHIRTENPPSPPIPPPGQLLLFDVHPQVHTTAGMKHPSEGTQTGAVQGVVQDARGVDEMKHPEPHALHVEKGPRYLRKKE